jgi:hypothetical protein
MKIDRTKIGIGMGVIIGGLILTFGFMQANKKEEANKIINSKANIARTESSKSTKEEIKKDVGEIEIAPQDLADYEHDRPGFEEANKAGILGISAVVEYPIIQEIHKMSNTLIVAQDGEIWGKKKITSKRCKKLYNTIKNKELFDEGTRKNLLTILDRWIDGDYSQGVDDHNYVWSMLSGTKGYATGLNKDTQKIVKLKGLQDRTELAID